MVSIAQLGYFYAFCMCLLGIENRGVHGFVSGPLTAGRVVQHLGKRLHLCSATDTLSIQCPRKIQEARGIQACASPAMDDVEDATTRHAIVQGMTAFAGAAIAGAGALSFTESAHAVPASPSFAVTEEDRRQVAETAIRWREMVTSGGPDAPKKTAALYAKDGVLWGTVSEEVRDTPEEIYDYFDYFARLPNLKLTEYTPVALRVYGDFATQAGTYTFAWQGKGGELKEKRARFSFTMRRDPESPTAWTIVEHHSSAMPTSPAELKRARNSA